MNDPVEEKVLEISPTIPPELMEIVCAGAQAQREVVGSVAVGGTVCALYAHHRESVDIDFIVPDLKVRFDQVLEHLLTLPEWKEARVRPPMLILGRFDRVEIGPLLVPTLDEMICIKAVLAYDRNTIRDFLDLAELSVLVGEVAAITALKSIDDKYGSRKQSSIAMEVAKTLAACEPGDGQIHAYSSFRFLSPRLKTWEQVKSICQSLGKALTLYLLEPP